MKKLITPADVTTGSELYMLQEILELDRKLDNEWWDGG